MANVTLKRWNGSAWVEMLTTPAVHTHTSSDITDLSSNVVMLSGNQTIGGTKTFSGNVNIAGTLDLTNAGVIGALDLSNNSITGVNNIVITDPGPSEGIQWSGGNAWAIYESPNDLTTNSGGNLQIVQSTTRRASFNTSGQLELPIATGTAPLLISSTTVNSNLNADLLDGNHASAFALSSHTHGNISNTGTATNTDFSPGSGVKLMVSDSTNTIGKSNIAFSGSGTRFLKEDGTWATPSDTDTNTYVTSAAFNTGTGVLTLTRNDAGTVTVDLDGKYAEASTALTTSTTFGGDVSGTYNAIVVADDSHNHIISNVDGLQTELDGKAATSHTHAATDITSGILSVARGGTGQSTISAGAIPYGATGGGSYTQATPGGTGQVVVSAYNGVNYYPTWGSLPSHTHSTSDITSGTLGVARGGTGATTFTSGSLLVGNGTSAVTTVAPDDASTLTVLSSSNVAPILERAVYWGTRYIHLGVTTTAGQNVSRTISFSTGMRNFILQIHQDTTTGAVIARLPLTISNSAGTSTVTDVYSLDTTTRTHRVAWSNGSTTQIMNVSISYSGTTVTVSHNFAFNAAFRLFGF